MGAIQPVDWPTWPQFENLEVEAVSRVVRSGQLFAASEVREFESKFAEYQGSRHSIGIGNATQGLHLALAALDIGQGDEVIVTPLSWISSASCILMQNAIPIFVDIEKESLGIDPELIERAITKRTRAIIVVHMLGYPAKIKRIMEIANQYGIPVIEDASHAPGALVDERKIGTFGEIGVFSLHQRKAISVGDGGVICTDNSEVENKIRRLRSFGFPELSYNYRMTEFAGALGKIGLQKLDEGNRDRIWAAEYLAAALKGVNWLKVRLSRPNEKGVYYAIALEVEMSNSKATEVAEKVASFGIPLRKIWEPLNRHSHFNLPSRPARGNPWETQNYNGVMRQGNYASLDLPVTYEYCYGKILELTAHPGINAQQLDSFVTILLQTYSDSVK